MAPDYRDQKMATLEGHGIAASLWEEFLDDEIEGLAEQAQERGRFKAAQPRLEYWPEDIRDEVATQVREEAELLGFWLAWHLAGGFRQLEQSGWHRATIFRKVRQFRDAYGAHPDETDFPWLTLDLRSYWRDKVIDNFRTPTATDRPRPTSP